MHARVTEFEETAAERYGLTVDPVEFPEKGTPTAEDAAEAVDCSIGAIVKSLVFDVDESRRLSSANRTQSDDVDGEAVLCLTSGAEHVDEAALAARAEVSAADISMAAPERVREVTGWAIGGVPPLGHDTSLPTLLDPTLRSFDEVWAAAGTPTSMWSIDPERLRELTDADVVEFTA